MIDEKETTIDYDAILGDFDGFLKERNWEGCNAIVDNLRDLGEYSKGIELAKRLTARKMTVPADYGEEVQDKKGYITVRPEKSDFSAKRLMNNLVYGESELNPNRGGAPY